MTAGEDRQYIGLVTRAIAFAVDAAVINVIALVVAFDAPSPDVAPPDSIARRLGLRRVRFVDGAVWLPRTRP